MTWDRRVDWETNYTLVTRIEWQEELETEVGGKNYIKRDVEGILCEGVDWIAIYIAQNNLRWYWNFGLYEMGEIVFYWATDSFSRGNLSMNRNNEEKE